ncbi:MAG: hypothetical protein AAGA86_07990, partial [Bacteroidota bacterium]
MSYKLFDKDGKAITRHDLQDKGVWCRDGASKERVFVEKYGHDLHLGLNPEKDPDPYVPDLLNTANGKLADLKTQNTPFFQARPRFGMDPQYTAVFNGKDRIRYKEKYPKIETYFAVDWQAITFQGRYTVRVRPMTGIWFIPFEQLDKILETSPYHTYRQRRNDNKGNAKGSYVLNLLD